jgi:hypothetical protein
LYRSSEAGRACSDGAGFSINHATAAPTDMAKSASQKLTTFAPELEGMTNAIRSALLLARLEAVC